MAVARYQQKCLEMLICSTRQLGVEIEKKELDKIAEIIVQTMTGPWRYYHTPAHVFAVGKSDNPIEVLAALFHDLVYVQVDRSVNFNLTYYIVPYIKEVKDRLLIREQEELQDDRTFAIVAEIFGFVPAGVLLPEKGQNEFLSAIVAAKILERFLKIETIVQIVACIEATIPFRQKSADGLTASDRLYHRLKNTNSKFNLGLTEKEIILTVKYSVKLANRDVSSFASYSCTNFLDNTWSLLPETNHHLKNPSSYTVREYRRALQKMEHFLLFLQPELIFSEFLGEPDENTYRGYLTRAKKNLEVGKLYLGCKLVAIAMLEALSYRFGRDIPLVMLMGELPSSKSPTIRLVNFLSQPINNFGSETEIENEVLNLLARGRFQKATYDLKESPLATFMVKSLGFPEILNLIAQAKNFFEENITAEEMLAKYKPDVLELVIKAIIELMESRKLALSEGGRGKG